ncbi:hypothetical protein TE33_10120 [Lacticaseibacillus paracasei]|nr:hypothetical protein TE33_10120 [Lacticaseibacillus paracasei]
MVVASPGNLCKINLNKRQRLRHFLNHKGIRSRFKCTSQSCAYGYTATGLIINNYIIRKLRFLEWIKYVPPPKNVLDVMKVTV